MKNDASLNLSILESFQPSDHSGGFSFAMKHEEVQASLPVASIATSPAFLDTIPDLTSG